MITVIGIFDDQELADEAASYLLANDFENEHVDIHTHGKDAAEIDRVGDFFNHLYTDEKEAAHYASLGRNGSIVTVHAVSTREAQEAVNVFDQYGAVQVNAEETPTGNRSLVVEHTLPNDKRLRG